MSVTPSILIGTSTRKLKRSPGRISREMTEYAASISTGVPAGIVSSRARNFVEVEPSGCDSWTEFPAVVGSTEDCDTAFEQKDITPNIKASDRLMQLNLLMNRGGPSERHRSAARSRHEGLAANQKCVAVT